jgi:hypothetical protein
MPIAKLIPTELERQTIQTYQTIQILKPPFHPFISTLLFPFGAFVTQI